MRYHNYHKHDHSGNPWVTDTIVKPEEYCKRAIELGHTTVFTTNHGVQGNIFDWMERSKEYGLKMCYGTESYFVRDRFQKDKSNKHIVIIAKNNSGVMQLNEIISESHTTGFYYRPRIDQELLFSLNSKDFIITSACVGGIWEDRELLLALNQKFKGNFFLELQSHDMELQKRVNSELLSFSKEAKIPFIHANDSHYIYPRDSEYRDIYLKGKERFYDNADEHDMLLDYPDDEEILARYDRQGILTYSQAVEALKNTSIFEECEEITLINDDIKLPSISDNPTEELKQIINSQWVKERNNIPKEKHQEYLDAIRYEMDIVNQTHMENYFLLDYKIVKKAQEEYGGRLTNTGRGSAPSFYITKLLGLTDIDRVSAPITLFPTRFMSVERILGTRSLPDIDLNTTDREPFIKATEDLLGKDNCAWMVAWKPLQDSSAFRLYCKGKGLHIKEYDEVAKNLDSYRDNDKWKQLIEESKAFIGVIESISESPCSMCLYDKPLKKELGLVRTNKGKICCLLDGLNCDKYKYLKNDYLTVTVWAIIKDVCELANIPIPTIKEIDDLLDDKTFAIYEKGLTSTINQVDSDYATNLVMQYQPTSLSDMSAFVAIIRPGCASLLQDFIHRKSYTTGVPELDELLIEGNHRMIYQELIMKYLIWLGVPESGSYDIIKKISKKKFKEKELNELKEILFSAWQQKVNDDNKFFGTWKTVEEASKYSFNASHSLSYAYDSLYGAYLKSHYPLEYYTVALNYYSDDKERTTRLTKELSHWNIKLNPIQFRYSRSGYSLSYEDNSIYKGIKSINNLSSNAAEEMYSLKDNSYGNFIDLLIDLKKETSLNATQLKILIELDYFAEFGDANYLLQLKDLFDKYYGRSQFNKSNLTECGLTENQVRMFAEKESEKQFNKVDSLSLIKSMAKDVIYSPRKLTDIIDAQLNYLGYISIFDSKYQGLATVVSVDTKYAPKLQVYSLKYGTIIECKIDKRTFNRTKLSKGNIIRVIGQKRKPKLKKVEGGGFEPIPGTKELWITDYKIVENL